MSQKQKTWPEILREFRAKHGMSQATLATLLPCGKRSLEDWEAGRRRPPQMLLRALKDVAFEDRG